ncbi:helix-turn-helix domain-containing protein [Sphingobacterium sp.]|uniref:helix-turn-helix domain-containing protein n=1 Tax=Sphingobacterium sp. TaxID=341027 RepID=UPI00338E044E
MKNEIKKRFEWIKLYETTGNTGVVCLRYGITRPTLRKWVEGFKESGIDGLSELRNK